MLIRIDHGDPRPLYEQIELQVRAAIGDGALPPGEWWVVDPAEGNVNHLHALPEWAVTATLVRDNQQVLTAVHLPLAGWADDSKCEFGAETLSQPLLRVAAGPARKLRG